MKFKQKYLLLFLFAIFHSCTEVNITKELSYIQLLDSTISKNTRQIQNLKSTTINEHISTATQRYRQLNNSRLIAYQKQWLYNELNMYTEIAKTLSHANNKLDSLALELSLSKIQLKHLKQDLIHRNISKKEFSQYFSQEQNAHLQLEADLIITEKKMKSKIRQLDSLEKELSNIIEQLQAPDNEAL